MRSRRRCLEPMIARFESLDREIGSMPTCCALVQYMDLLGFGDCVLDKMASGVIRTHGLLRRPAAVSDQSTMHHRNGRLAIYLDGHRTGSSCPHKVVLAGDLAGWHWIRPRHPAAAGRIVQHSRTGPMDPVRIGRLPARTWTGTRRPAAAPWRSPAAPTGHRS